MTTVEIRKYKSGTVAGMSHVSVVYGDVRLMNCTPHEITVVGEAGEVVLTLPPSGMVARCSVKKEHVATLGVGNHNIPVSWVTFGEVVDLPEPVDGVIYVVSRIVAEARRDRDDLLIPDDLVRDAEGRVIGCRGFSTVADKRRGQ